jgi:hypothetical protein
MIEHTDPRLVALLGSYEHWLGIPLCAADALFDAPFAVLAHGVESPPILWYGNRTALDLWDMDFEAFTRMPSHLTAEPDLRDARAALLREVSTQGFSSGYRGIRVSRSGRRFEIDRATVWNILDESGQRIGQAATFDRWSWLDAYGGSPNSR